ncbi:MAG: ATP-binding protein [Candidatus Eisenbacteria bacterium]|nr:ATP-binding protein [Candidatus Eisenbacteria bacterium]
MDRELARVSRQLIVSISLVLLALIALCSWLLYRMVHVPVKRLMKETQRIGGGDLTGRIPIASDDELGRLAVSFNRMTAELALAREKEAAWARTLESRVEEKSRALERAQEEMLQTQKMASMGKLAAIVAHEINNPLAGIRTYAKLLGKRASRRAAENGPDSASSETQEILAQIESEATRCGEIVKNLLQFSRPSRPKAEPCDINELVRGTVRLVQHQIDLQGLRCELDLAADLPSIVCDPQQIRQAFVAVLINACEAMQGESGSGVLSVTTRRDSEGRGICVQIRDTGVGMDEETRRHLFEPFYTTKEGGAGLGLAVVYGILEGHGGKVDVESVPGEGTSFRFHLPPQPPENREGQPEVAK